MDNALRESSDPNDKPTPSKELIVIERFRPQMVDGKKAEDIKILMHNFMSLADEVMHFVPDCADRTHALRLLLDAKMWCTQAISHNGL